MEIKIDIMGEERVVMSLHRFARKGERLLIPFADLGERLVRKISRRLSGEVLTARSAKLKGSLTYAPTEKKLTVTAGGTPGVRYARIHQKGGTITPKRRKALTIPFPGGPADRPVPLRARDFKDTFVAKGIIFQKQKHGIVPLFILRKRVRIPARPYMEVDNSDIAYLQKRIRDYLTGDWAG